MQNKLSQQQVLRIHKMKAQGFSTGEIARSLGVGRTAIIPHVQLRTKLSYSTAIAIKAFAPLPRTSCMTIYQAAAMLPGHPDRCRLFRLIRDGVLQVSRETAPFSTTLQAVREAALADLDPGLYFSSATVEAAFPAEAARLAASAERIKHRMHAPRQQWYYRACDVPSACKVDAALIRRAVFILDRVGVATV